MHVRSLALAFLAVCAGCGPQPSRIHGRIVLDDRPLDGVSLYFRNASAGFASLPTNDQGEFDLKIIDAHVDPGTYAILITDPKNAADMMIAAHTGLSANSGRTPMRYCLPDKTPLTAELRPGSNDIGTIVLVADAVDASKQ